MGNIFIKDTKCLICKKYYIKKKLKRLILKHIIKIEIIQYYGDFANLQSSYVNLIHSMSAERPVMEQGGNPFRWGAKISSLQVEFSIVPNTDHAGQYLVSVTSYVRDLSPDFRCW